MSSTVVAALLWLMVVVGVPHASRAKAMDGNGTDAVIDRTLTALASSLNFFRKEYQSINLDAVIGTRMVEGTLKILLDNLQEQGLLHHVSLKHEQEIRHLRNLARKVSDDAMPFVAAAAPDYYRRIGAILAEGFWELDFPSRDLDSTIPVWDYRMEETMQERDSDDCLAELFGTGTNSKKQCNISDKCWKMMTANGYSGYSLSHEIFYLEIGERFGCLPQMLWKVLSHHQASLKDQKEKLCANMLTEARLLADNDYPPPKQDLFMEQAGLCGMLGYRQFINSDWLEEILSWQDLHIGCFRGSNTDGLGKDRADIQVAPARMKREEKRLPDGCLCHRTTVASAAIAQYVRFIIEADIAAKLETNNS